MTTRPREDKVIIYFDGVCNLCNHIVDFFIRRDKHDKFLFCSLQSDQAHARLPSHYFGSAGLSSVVVEYQGQFWSQSRAVIKALQMLGGGYRLFSLALLLPKKLTDLAYEFIAKNRYKWFGKRETCRVPSTYEKNKFL